MWFGTDNGVARFDGYEFTVFDNDDGLEDVVVFSIREDGEGVLWASTYSGRLYYFDHNKFKPFLYNDRLEQWKTRNSIINLVDADFRDGFLVSVRWFGYLFVSRQGEVDFVVEINEPAYCTYNKPGEGEFGEVNGINSTICQLSRSSDLARKKATKSSSKTVTGCRWRCAERKNFWLGWLRCWGEN